MAAVGAVLVLAGLLGLRLVAGDALAGQGTGAEIASPGRAVVPAPRVVTLEDLPTPVCWACKSDSPRPLKFQIDLDILAPLGTGEANAAVWFRDFAKPDGRRYEEYMGRLTPGELRGRQRKMLAADDPLLAEAEPWVNQAHHDFHPEIFPFEGVHTRIPNLLFAFSLANSWVARGDDLEDREAAREDYRRAIRMGRLLLQEEVTLIQKLVGMACVRVGAEALYDQARGDGDGVITTAAAIVVNDHTGMRLLAAKRVTQYTEFYGRVLAGRALKMTDDDLTELIGWVREEPEPTVRPEGMFALYAVRHLGTPDQRRKAEAALDEMMHDPHPSVVEAARWCREQPLDWAVIEMMAKAL